LDGSAELHLGAELHQDPGALLISNEERVHL
jgi:hypothetical protein